MIQGTLDLVVRGGRVVTAGDDAVADVGVRDGRIVAIAEELADADRVVDARDRLVLPAGVDAHVHLTPAHLEDRELHWADDFASGTTAAAAGGVATVGNICFAKPGEALRAARARVRDEAEGQALVDFVLHPVMLEPTDRKISELSQLAREGAGSLKLFMHMGDFDAKADRFLEAMRVAGQHGLVTMLHCEDRASIAFQTRRLEETGRTGLEYFPETRPIPSEAVAVERAVGYAELTGATLYVVHLASRRALEAARRGRRRGLDVFVETRPTYLVHTEKAFQGDDAALLVGNPPPRTEQDRRALWAGLANGDVATCCTDHAPWTLEDKTDPELDVTNLRPGMGDLELNMPLLFSEGVVDRGLSLQRFVELTSTSAARIFGLYPRKGTIAVGGDADLVIWNPQRQRTVRGAELHTAAGWSHVEGRRLTGWPEVTISRGQIVWRDGQRMAEYGRGRLIATVADRGDEKNGNEEGTAR